MEKKSKFYKLNKERAEDFLFSGNEISFLEDSFFCFLSEKKIGKFNIVKIGRVFAVLVDRIVFDREYEFIVQNTNRLYECFIEVSFEDVRKSIDNTDALLSNKIFRR